MGKQKGKFIVLEGIDGSGKSTQCKLLVDKLNKLGRPTKLYKNISDGKLGKMVREFLNPDNKLYVNNLQAASLFIAELYIVADSINKDLEDGYNVVCDRWTMSTVAYASTSVIDSALSFVRDSKAILSMYNTILKPDKLIFLDIEPAIAIQRVNVRNDTVELYDTENKLVLLMLNYKHILADMYVKALYTSTMDDVKQIVQTDVNTRTINDINDFILSEALLVIK